MLPKKMKKLENLELLCLDNNNLLYIPKDIGKLYKLKKLYISFNRLHQLPKSLNNLENLHYICCLVNSIGNLNEITIKDKLILYPKDLAKMDSINATNKMLKNLLILI